MITDKYIAPEEMNEILLLCSLLDGVERSLMEKDTISTDILSDDEGLGRTFGVYDSNGELLGHIGHTGNGFALYLDDGVEQGEDQPVVEGVEIKRTSTTPLPFGEKCPECGQASSGYHLPGVSFNCK